MSRSTFRKAGCTFVLVLCYGSAVRAQFIPGRVYVSQPAIENCLNSPPQPQDQIWEIDPATGQSRLFFTSPHNLCGGMTGLAFTPNGLQLRMSMYWHSLILAVDRSANATGAYDSNSGVHGPYGSNNLVFNAAADFFVVNHTTRNIVRFPGDVAPPAVFADINDGVQGLGPLAVGPDGALYYATLHTIYRFTPEGEGAVFDVVPDTGEIASLAVDSEGRLFALSDCCFGRLYRYGPEQRDWRRLLASNFFAGAAHAMCMSDDDRAVYIADGARLLKIETHTGSTSVVGAVPWYPTFGLGIAVYRSHPADANCDDAVSASDVQPFVLCLLDQPAYSAAFPNCTVANCDVNSDGFVDGADIQGFVDAVLRG